MKQEIRFCTTPDNVRIAYAITGKGPPLVKAANYLSHLEFDWQSPVWRHFLDTLSTDTTLIRYDERGCGLSDWDPQDFSFDAWVRDLESVVDTVGIEKFPLLGISQGGAVAIEYAARHPEKVTQLILCGGYARGWGKRGSTKIIEERQASMTLTKHGWGRDDPGIRQYFTSKFLPDGTMEQIRWFNDLQRVSCSSENAVRFQEVFGEVDVTKDLPNVKAPTLVIHSRGDLSVPFEEGRLLAAGIPNCRLVALESRNHVLLETDPAWPKFVSEVRSFLGKRELVSTVEKPRKKNGLGISGWIKGPQSKDA
jgi:pimeloyl-ACP methyl ester carboxylesterase